MSACRGFRDLLSAQVDGALAPKEAARLKEHLGQCPACARALEELKETVARIRSLEPVEPPPWLTERILARVRTPGVWRRRILPLARRPQLQAAALVLICFTGLLILRDTGAQKVPLAPAQPEPPAVTETPQEPPAPRRAEPRRQGKAKEAPPSREKAAPPAAEAMPAPTMLRDAATAGSAMAKKAEARSLAAESPALILHLDAAVPAQAGPRVLEALGRLGTVIHSEPRSATARLEGRRLPELKAALEKAGRIRESLPEEVPPETVVTIFW